MFANTSAVILAGGRGSRISGQDKGLLLHENKPFSLHLLERFRPAVNRIYINANRNLDIYNTMGVTVVKDKLSNFQGPLAGILATLDIIETDFLFTIPCDAPSLPVELLESLHRETANSENRLIVTKDKSGLQPTCCLIHKDLAEELRDFLDKGNRKMFDWINSQPYIAVDVSNFLKDLININTQQELDNLRNENV